MARVLTIEDDALVVDDIVRRLTSGGFAVDVAQTGREGMAKVMAGDYDVVTLDRVLPDLDGLTIVSTMRGVGMETPVLVMSAMSDIDERIRGLREGGDDYLTKPFSLDEMFARIEALLRRRPKHVQADTVLRVGPLELDLIKRRVTRGSDDLSLQPTEFRVLEFMMRHPRQVLTRTMILEAVWGCRFDPGTNLIDVHVGRLRKKVDTAGALPLIRTIRGSGYMLG
jgi:two-component system, OmpR family, response regulator